MIIMRFFVFSIFVLLTSCVTPPKNKTSKTSKLLMRVDRNRLVSDEFFLHNNNPNLSKIYKNFKNENWNKTIESSLVELKKDPYNLVLLLLVSLAYYSQNKIEKAYYYVNLADEISPNRSEILNLIGLYHYRKSVNLTDYLQAKNIFNRAIKLSSNNVSAILNLSYLYLDMGDVVKAKVHFMKARKKCDNCIDAQVGYAISLSRLSENDKSISVLQDILKKDSQNIAALYHSALYYRNIRKNYRESSEYLEQILSYEDSIPFAVKEKVRLVYFDNQNQISQINEEENIETSDESLDFFSQEQGENLEENNK